jgi:cytosine deaminase
VALPIADRVLLQNARVPAVVLGEADGTLRSLDIFIENGAVTSVTASGGAPVVGATIRDMDGGVVLPAFVDIHTHVDKGHIWPRRPNPDGTWLSALLAVGDDRVSLWKSEDVERRMEFALRCAYAHGTAALRTHIDSIPPQDEISWALFERMRERWAGRIELQGTSIISPEPMLDLKILDRVARRTKQAGGSLGGAIAEHPRSKEAMLNVVRAAIEHGLDLDLHVDECLDPTASSLLHLAEAVVELNFKGRVLAGHCCAVTVQDDAAQQRTIEAVREAGIAIISLPLCNLYLMNRDGAGGTTPLRRGVTLIKEFAAAGVPVVLASDNTRDPFYAYGDLDALEVFREGARIAHFDHPQQNAWDWIETITTRSAALAAFSYTAKIAAGSPADLILFRARSWTELLSRPQSDRIVLRGGKAIDTTLPDYRELDDLMEA